MLLKRLSLIALLAAPGALLAETAPVTGPSTASQVTSSTDAAAAEEGPEILPSGTIYLLARMQLTGTDLAQAAFLHERSITTLEACEKERNNGLTTGWQAYRHYLKTYKGISYKVDYRCVSSEQKISRWRLSQPQDLFYMVRSAEQKLTLTRYPNFFACRDALQGRGLRESVDSFCAKAGQRLID